MLYQQCGCLIGLWTIDVNLYSTTGLVSAAGTDKSPFL